MTNPEQESKRTKHTLTRRTLHYYWIATRNHLGLFLGLLASTIGFVGLLTYGNPYVMSLIVDRVSAGPVTSRRSSSSMCLVRHAVSSRT